MESQTDETNYGNSAVINRTITRTPSPEPDYDSDTSDEFSDLNASTTTLHMNSPSIATQEKEDDTSGILYDESFECLDDLVMLELLEPPLESGAIPDWKSDWPDVGKYWTDLNSHDNGEMIEEETSTGNDLGQEEPKEVSQKSTNEKIIEVLLNEFEKNPKEFKPYGKSLLQKVEQVTGVKSTSMPSKFRRDLNPMLPELDLETDLHLSFMKKARTEIKEQDKKKLEKRHCVTIKLNKKNQINSWKKEASNAGRKQGLVDYSSSDSEAET
ncbi:hypothetical protein CAEBREN_02773 [Caenorhabditis brenneri]|uniref:Uncharacterized protein n=1 Tax=Caenorhabditis brenneri TaxID=135651 RepID=G0P0C2_CAEBE|nr:hypothetical protein CAEBREN_02773 [Caenorhabditis brenneri]